MLQEASKQEKLFTFRSGGWVLLLAGFFTLVAAGLVLYPVLSTGGFHRMLGDGRNIDTYGFDLSNLAIPKEKLVASGNSKDQIRAIPESLVETITPGDVQLMADNEHIRFLVPSDRIIGILLNGTARAYPLRVLNYHEMVNDIVGGTPVGVSFSPLSDSAVVFDRRIDGPSEPAAEFGVSGLMVASTTVYFDRRGTLKDESLWPQLEMKAVSGPAVGKTLTLVPYVLTTWEKWKQDHPDTRVLRGLRTHKSEYGSDPYNLYGENDDVRFPVQPYWNVASVPRKTRIVAASSDGKQWRVAREGTSVSEPMQIHAYLFAWYAEHEGDTDYSAVKP
ncbi:MAG TPA: DUF3179 domain-containing (seleno)protein [Phycisphaerae bacterium]|nr:DUF3179 domain-containing (seleno)protein [Phycisphaerae bacterium]